MANQKGIILTIVLIFVIVLCMIAGVSVILMSNQAVVTEGNIGRTKAFYTGQAAVVQMIDALRASPTDTQAIVTVNNTTVTAKKIPRELPVPGPNCDYVLQPNCCNSPATSISCIRVDVDYL